LVSTVVGRGACTGGVSARAMVANPLTAESIGDEVLDGDEVRWTGLRPIGGGIFFDVELVVELESRRSDDCCEASLDVGGASFRDV